MKKPLLFFVFLFSIGFAYSQEYNITTMQSNYDTLTTYNSLTQELIAQGEDPFDWEAKIDFGFDFPFFNGTYQSIETTPYGLILVDADDEVNMALFGGPIFIVDTMLTPDSEVRYSTISEDENQALVVEFHNVYHGDEFLLNGKNHYLNLQHWFYDDGRIQVRFGDIDLDSCTHYIEGKGFLEEPESSNETFGPYVGILKDISNLHCYSGTYEDGGLVYGEGDCGPLSTIPPSGSIIQFAINTDTTSVEDVFYTKNENLQYTVLSEGSTLKIQGDLSNYSQARIYDTMGRLLYSSSESIIELDVHTSAQVVIVQVIAKDHQESHKVLIKR